MGFWRGLAWSFLIGLTGCAYFTDSPEQAVREFLRYGPGSPTPDFRRVQPRLCAKSVEGTPLPERIRRLYDTLDDLGLVVDYEGATLTGEITGNRATVTVRGTVKRIVQGQATTTELTGDTEVLTLIRTGGGWWQICPH